jgi:hypothetical protein
MKVRNVGELISQYAVRGREDVPKVLTFPGFWFSSRPVTLLLKRMLPLAIVIYWRGLSLLGKKKEKAAYETPSCVLSLCLSASVPPSFSLGGL